MRAVDTGPGGSGSLQTGIAGSRALVITFRTVSVRSGLTAREISTK
jgi:hypothetical protein